MNLLFADTPSPGIRHDVNYLGPDRAEKLDIYLPPENFARPVPAVLFIHGGGWRLGDKAGKREVNIGGTLAAHGYAVFSINYLLNVGDRDAATGKTKLTSVAWPQNLHDCKTALRFIRKESARYGINPDRIATMGGSAGGHLAMLVGATANRAEINRHGLYTEQSNGVTCIINFYGEYDVSGRWRASFAGDTPEKTVANARAASPVTYLDKNTPPMFITHGSADKTIPAERSRMLTNYLEKLGVDYLYVEIGGAPHSYDLEPAQMDLRPAVLTFLEKYLGKPASAAASNKDANATSVAQ
ncbi:alpha/beta hydrolase [Termitidicoccus mucosus]|uniref:Lipase n=1 Tax=Termitidicoccus mucosus TaxID=1184151 RepID=A0A178IJW5_9BACT|nr:lipase [Opitutaceae bacterium TSB47]